MTNLSVYLNESANKYPDASALVCDDRTTSYFALANEVARFADYLTYGGLQPGDPVGVMLPNGPEFAVVFYGILHAGGVVVPLNPSLHARAVEFYLTITGARMLFVSPRHAVAYTVAAVTAGTQPVEIKSHGIEPLTAGFAGRVEPVSRTACDAAVVLPAAETNGAHAVELTHGELADSQAEAAELLLPLGPKDVVMGCLPMNKRSGMICGLLATISSGATLVLPSFDPVFDPASALETIATERVTVFEGDPAMYVAMRDAAHHSDEDFSSLRVCVSAGGSVPADIVRRVEDTFELVVVDADELVGVGLATERIWLFS
jgi:long-chain acyl-CoA synthetase